MRGIFLRSKNDPSLIKMKNFHNVEEIKQKKETLTKKKREIALPIKTFDESDRVTVAIDNLCLERIAATNDDIFNYQLIKMIGNGGKNQIQFASVGETRQLSCSNTIEFPSRLEKNKHLKIFPIHPSQ